MRRASVDDRTPPHGTRVVDFLSGIICYRCDKHPASTRIGNPPTVPVCEGCKATLEAMRPKLG